MVDAQQVVVVMQVAFFAGATVALFSGLAVLVVTLVVTLRRFRGSQ